MCLMAGKVDAKHSDMYREKYDVEFTAVYWFKVQVSCRVPTDTYSH